MKLFQICVFCIGILSYSQNNFDVTVQGIQGNDSIQIIMQKSVNNQLSQWVKNNEGEPLTISFNLSDGLWALIIDATGYTYPPAKVIDVPNDYAATVTLTPLSNQNYSYQWSDDDSYAGHATQTYINEPYSLQIIDSTINVPNDFSSITLRNEFGIVLSDSETSWNQEDAYKLYNTVLKVPIIEKIDINSSLNYENGENIKLILTLTEDEIYKDIEVVDNSQDVLYARITKSAFVYSEPLVGILDGIKSKFYSKRLYNSVVYYATDFGTNATKINDMAQQKFGVEFMDSSQRTEDLMNETKSNFQEFHIEEKIEILSMFEELPEGTHKLENLKYLVRRINGQDNPKIPGASAIAWGWGDNGTIEFMSKGFNGVEIGATRRLILHEKAHFIYWELVDQETKNEWIEVGGWFVDPTSASGWSTYNTTESVSAYGHANGPGEDFAEFFAMYVENVDNVKTVSMTKYEFFRDKIMHGTRYISQIREDLTFQVYNLWPDYTYPGKVTSVNLNVSGESEDDKVVTVELKLHCPSFPDDGASGGGFSIYSTIGSVQNIGLSPKNGTIDSVLVGQTTLSKYVKNGYWKPGTIEIRDEVGNKRYENTSTIGFKLWIENPLEDISPPIFNDDFQIDVVQKKFDPTTSNWDNFEGHETGNEVNTLQIKGTAYDGLPLKYFNASVFFPRLDHEYAQLYDFGIFDEPHVEEENGITNGFENTKHYDMLFPIMDWSPSGWYSVSQIRTEDLAKNGASLYLVNDLESFDDSAAHIYEALRDSIYIQTNHPDYIAPEIDLNNIIIDAEPTNAESPNGETRVDLSFLVRDLSDYAGYESGAKQVWWTLRNPLGYEFTFSSEGQSDVLEKNRTTFLPHGHSDWELVRLNKLLPRGSAPGEWGMSSMHVIDRNNNIRKYSFTEYVRFDVIESDIELTVPLSVEITDKVVNLNNVNSITANISCTPCQGLNYIYTIYSLMGGNVVRGNGVFSSDQITIGQIDTEGVLDGVLKITAQVTDTENQLVATKSSEYTKDTVRPSGYYTRSNIQDQGTSSLDDFIIQIIVESVDVGGTFSGSAKSTNNQNGSKQPNSSTQEISFSGQIINETISLSNLNLSSLEDGYVEVSLDVIDPNGNSGASTNKQYYKIENGQIEYIGTNLSTEKNLINEIKIYPNPASKIVFVRNINSNVKVSVFSITGKAVIEKEINSDTQIDVSKLNKGVYFFNLTNGKSTTTMKVVVE